MRGDNEELYTRALRCINSNQLAEAESTLGEALAVAEESYGPKHAETAQCLMMLGIVLEKEGKLAAAEAKLRRCANIRKELFGEDSSVFGITLNVLASTVAAQGGEKLEEGENLFKKCVDHAERVLGHVHANTAVAYLQLGRTQVMGEKMEEAERSLRTCVEIRTEALGRNHPETINALGTYSEVLRKLAKTEEADEIDREMQDLQAIQSFNVFEGDRGRPVEHSGPKQQISVNASGYEPVVEVSDIVRAAELDNKDRWGFQYDDQMAARLKDYERNFFAAKRARREARFEKALKRYGRVEDIPPEELKEFGRKGFPDRHRIEVWEYRLEVEAVRSRHERDFYETLLRKDLPAKIGKVIEVDLRRTFPHHPAFQEDNVVERLRN
ncbi:Tetratricopeptide repeat protein 19, mitochondrial, partial [Perkinsus olseni]